VGEWRLRKAREAEGGGRSKQKEAGDAGFIPCLGPLPCTPGVDMWKWRVYLTQNPKSPTITLVFLVSSSQPGLRLFTTAEDWLCLPWHSVCLCGPQFPYL
jgi:hypothetical protein